VLALANPVANFEEEREPVTSIVALVVDRSPSQMSSGPHRDAPTRR
jgi:hypothetical protein